MGSKAITKARCGLCGGSKKLTRTDCCGGWICDDEGKYVLFSYARNSCYRNHRRYTLCAYHHTEGHEGDWKACKSCRVSFEAEIYAWYGTNEYNFTVLANPPAFKPKKCSKCKRLLRLADGGYMRDATGYWCEPCAHRKLTAQGAASS